MLVITVSNLVRKSSYKTKINEIENKITVDRCHDEYISTQEINKLTSENFTARLKQANLASKIDIANFLKKTDFNNKIKDVTSNKNELNELSKRVKAILIKDLINKIIILNEAKYFSLKIFQNYLICIPAKTTLNILVTLLEFNCGNLMKCQKKVLKV